MIMDSEHQCFDSSDFTDSHLSINLGADPLQKDVQHQMALSTFAAAIAEYNDHNGSFNDEWDSLFVTGRFVISIIYPCNLTYEL